MNTETTTETTTEANTPENVPQTPSIFSTRNAPRPAGDYASAAQLLMYLQDVAKPDDVSLLQSLVTRYSRLLDTACQVEAGHFETADAVATTRNFYFSRGRNVLYIGPHVENSIENVKWNGLQISLNDLVDDGLSIEFGTTFWNNCQNERTANGFGISEHSHTDFNSPAAFYGYVEVTARWGEDNIRHDVAEAVLSMAAQSLRLRTPIVNLNAEGKAQPLFHAKQTEAWKIVVEREIRNRRWSDFRPA